MARKSVNERNSTTADDEMVAAIDKDRKEQKKDSSTNRKTINKYLEKSEKNNDNIADTLSNLSDSMKEIGRGVITKDRKSESGSLSNAGKFLLDDLKSLKNTLKDSSKTGDVKEYVDASKMFESLSKSFSDFEMKGIDNSILSDFTNNMKSWSNTFNDMEGQIVKLAIKRTRLINKEIEQKDNELKTLKERMKLLSKESDKYKQFSDEFKNIQADQGKLYEEKMNLEEKANQKVRQSFGQMIKEGWDDAIDKNMGALQGTFHGIVKGIGDKLKLEWDLLKERFKIVRFTARVFKNTYEHVKTAITDMVGKISSHINEVLGPVAEAFDVVKSALQSTWKVAKGIAGVFFGGDKDKDKSSKWLKKLVNLGEGKGLKVRDSNNSISTGEGITEKGLSKAVSTGVEKDTDPEKQTGLLGKMSSYFKRQEKASQRGEKGEKKKGIMGILMGALKGIGALLGTAFGSLFGMGLGTFVFGLLKKGLKFLFNPKKMFKLGIIALLGLMIKDMIKGWIKGETLEDKAILGAVGLLTIPGKIVEWAVNGILGLFGSDFKIDLSPEAIEKGLRNMNKWIFDNVTVPILEFFEKIGDFFTVDIPLFFSVTLPAKFAETKTWIDDNILTPISNFFASIWQLIEDYTPLGWIVKGIKNIIEYFKTPIEGESTFDKIITMATDLFSGIWQLIEDYTPLGWIVKGIKKLEEFFSTPGEDGKSIFDKTIDFFQNIGKRVKEWWENSSVGKMVSKVTGLLGTDKNLKAAKESGIYDKDIIGNSEIDKEKIRQGIENGTVTKEMLNAILADSDMNKENTDWIKKMAEEATTKGSLFTHDIYLEKLFKKSLGIEEDGVDSTVAATQGAMSKLGNYMSSFLPSLAPKGVKKQEKQEEKKSFFSSMADWGKKGLENLGIISKKYETGGRGAGTVSSGKGDYGGVSYGSYQMASRGGQKSTAAQFVKNSKWSDKFEGLQAGSKEFSDQWKEVAAQDLDEFEKAQHEYIKETHFNPLAEKVKEGTGLDVSKRSKAVQEALWSVSVQHGGNTGLVNKSLAGKDQSKMSDQEVLDAINKERTKETASGQLAYFKSSSANVQEGLRNRFTNERQDQQNLLDSVKKPGGKIESAEADKVKAKQEVYLKTQEIMAKKDQDRGEMTRVMKESSLKTDKYQSSMAKKGSNINNTMIASSGGGGGQGSTEIPEEIDNYLLGLTVTGILS